MKKYFGWFHKKKYFGGFRLPLVTRILVSGWLLVTTWLTHWFIENFVVNKQAQVDNWLPSVTT